MISETSDLGIEALHDVEHIEGSLYIVDSTAVRDLDALEQLEMVSGHVSLVRLPNLENIDGLAALAAIGGQLILSDLIIQDLRGLDGVASVGSTGYFADLQLEEQSTELLPRLVDAEGIDVSRVGGLRELVLPPGRFVARVSVAENPDLEELRAPREMRLGYALEITDNPALLEVGGLSGCRCENASVTFARNDSLESLDIFSGTASVASLSFSSNAALQFIDVGSGPSTVGSFYVANNWSLVEIRGIAGNLQVSAFYFFGNIGFGDPESLALAAMIEPTGYQKVGRNSAAWQPLDDCPWSDDRMCDEPPSMLNPFGTGLCAIDSTDCALP